MARTSRRSTARETTVRARPYTPPAKLDAPTPKSSDVVYRWVRVTVQNEDDGKNIAYRHREGYEPVMAAEHPDWIGPRSGDARFQGAIGSGDLVLMKTSADIVEGRKQYYENETRTQIDAADADQFSRAPDKTFFYQPERKSTVAHGSKRPSFQDGD
jgi:hypothetical protein